MCDIDRVLREYSEKERSYADYAAGLAVLLQNILQCRGVQPHRVVGRVKSKTSFEKKVRGNPPKYTEATKVLDFAGVRVVTFFVEDLPKVRAIIDEEFAVDHEASSNKRDRLQHDQFGYLSEHFIVTLDRRRTQMPEYERFKGMVAEIQVRTILQHAWAEVEHDLRYKAPKREVPDRGEIDRRFARLAAMLEVADKEIGEVRTEVAKYREELPEQIEHRPQYVHVNRDSLLEFIKVSDLPRRIDREIAETLSATLLLDQDYIDGFIDKLSALKILTISALADELKEHERRIAFFAREMLQDKQYSQLYKGICLHYLVFVRVALNGDERSIEAKLNELDIGRVDERLKFAARLKRLADQFGDGQTP